MGCTLHANGRSTWVSTVDSVSVIRQLEWLTGFSTAREAFRREQAERLRASLLSNSLRVHQHIQPACIQRTDHKVKTTEPTANTHLPNITQKVRKCFFWHLAEVCNPLSWCTIILLTKIPDCLRLPNTHFYEATEQLEHHLLPSLITYRRENCCRRENF